ncbi:MAG: hypothetical protein AVDCRST_MAG69-804, partial [uncultured Solirubrobacteraceae bacterium]
CRRQSLPRPSRARTGPPSTRRCAPGPPAITTCCRRSRSARARRSPRRGAN